MFGCASPIGFVAVLKQGNVQTQCSSEESYNSWFLIYSSIVRVLNLTMGAPGVCEMASH